MCILKCFDKIPDMSSSALASLGLGVLTGDVYKKVLAVVIERDLGPGDLAHPVPRNFNVQRKQKA